MFNLIVLTLMLAHILPVIKWSENKKDRQEWKPLNSLNLPQ